MKVKCPTCGNVGSDVQPIPEHLRGPSWKPLRGEESYSFAIHGRMGGRAVRKCLKCGSGVFVKLLPPRYQAIPPGLWEEMQEYFEEQMAESEARTEALLDQLERERVAREAAADPAFQGHVETLLDRVNELWGSPKNPLIRERRESPPGELEQAIIQHVVRSTTPTYVIDAMERGVEPDEARMNDETNVLMLLAAGGYLWREAERELATDDAPLEEAQSAVEWMNEHPMLGDTERFEKLARAVFWTLESFSSLALARNAGAANGEATLDVGFQAIAEFACQQAGLDPSQMVIGDDGMRAAFKAGVALREVEPLLVA